ncbi:MAG: hypothetical protein EBY16_10035 [Gammaproteobacteria bacterium]|nr:hypothetical protein [Gammaproteobacteria bacterium]
MPVNVTGVKELIKAMDLVDSNLNKEMQNEIKAVMIPVRDKAKGYMPANAEVLSGWRKINVTAEQKYRAFPFYDQDVAKNGIYYSKGSTRRNQSGFSITNFVANKSASGAIFETAGRRNPRGAANSKSLNPNAGIQFIESAENLSQLKGEGNQRGRAIYRAWFEESNKVYPAVVKAIDTVATKFNNGQIRKVA